jgi:hypothetical protein
MATDDAGTPAPAPAPPPPPRAVPTGAPVQVSLFRAAGSELVDIRLGNEAAPSCRCENSESPKL